MKGFFDDLIKKAQSLEDLGNLIKEAEKAEKKSGLVRFGDMKVPGEVSVEIEPEVGCRAMPCADCPVARGECEDRENYTWTITATPKKPQKD